MTEADLGFDKDVTEPRLALKRLRACLGSPLDLPIMGDEALAAVASTNEGSCWTLAGHWLELPGEQKLSAPILPVNTNDSESAPSTPGASSLRCWAELADDGMLPSCGNYWQMPTRWCGIVRYGRFWWRSRRKHRGG
jgi:hypothetical protein